MTLVPHNKYQPPALGLDYSISDYIIKEVFSLKDKCYSEIARQVLGRDPIIDDAKEFCIATNKRYPGKELVSYKGAVFGRVDTNTDGHRIGFTFNPHIVDFTTTVKVCDATTAEQSTNAD